jgi:hypothetical protein
VTGRAARKVRTAAEGPAGTAPCTSGSAPRREITPGRQSRGVAPEAERLSRARSTPPRRCTPAVVASDGWRSDRPGAHVRPVTVGQSRGRRGGRLPNDAWTRAVTGPPVLRPVSADDRTNLLSLFAAGNWNSGGRYAPGVARGTETLATWFAADQEPCVVTSVRRPFDHLPSDTCAGLTEQSSSRRLENPPDRGTGAHTPASPPGCAWLPSRTGWRH